MSERRYTNLHDLKAMRGEDEQRPRATDTQALLRKALARLVLDDVITADLRKWADFLSIREDEESRVLTRRLLTIADALDNRLPEALWHAFAACAHEASMIERRYANSETWPSMHEAVAAGVRALSEPQ